MPAIIQQSIANGEFVQVNPQDVATALIGSYEGLMLLWVMSPKTMHLKESGCRTVVAGGFGKARSIPPYRITRNIMQAQNEIRFTHLPGVGNIPQEGFSSGTCGGRIKPKSLS
ncbi:MAG: hypothetical protein KDD74_15420 [Anaerolineales bacterium]|nr:hypothetical protein [Anaerolineales bacterium]